MKDPAVDYVTSAVGTGGPNQGNIFVALKPKDQRDSIDVIMSRLRRSTAVVPGINVVFQPMQNLNLNGGRASRAPYQYTLQATDLESLYAKAPEMLAKLQQLPMLRDVNSDLQIRNPTISIDIDRDKAAAFGLTSDQIRTALYNAYGTRQISTIFTEASDYEVILETSHALQDDPSALGRVFIRAQTGSGGTGSSSSSSSSSSSGTSTTSSGVSSAPIIPLDQVATLRRYRGAADGQSPVAAAFGDLVVQHGAGRLDRRSGRGHHRAPNAKSACRPRSRPIFRGRRRCSRMPRKVRCR